MAEPEILFEDTHLLVVSKPAGLLSQGEHTGTPNLVDWARAHVGRHYVGLVHRLDRNTSGALVLAKRTKAADRLTRALQEGALTRTYWAWVEGSLPKTFRWSHRIFKDEARNVSQVIRPGDFRYPKAKEAVLEGRALLTTPWQGEIITQVEFRLETGRSHQIRVQAAFEGHPLIGDSKYGSEAPFPRTALHSRTIGFPHPMSGERLEFTAPLPEDLQVLPSN